MLLILYGLTIFVSATLLFLVQPMFARMALPLLGGAPAVWNTAQVFYQAALLCGYSYAHLSTKWLGVRRQAALHLALLLLPLLALPIGIPAGWTPPRETNPSLWLLALLAVAVGLPFFVVSTSSPLLQKWFTGTGHRAAADPYFLYAASNVGSMLALLSYPLLVEPSLGLLDQSWLWALGYGLLLVLMAACAICLWRAPRPASVAAPAAAVSAAAPERLSARRRLRWVALSFVPSSLMLSVTTYLSTDIAAIPLLWVIPLALYLLTFILVFATRPPLPHWLMIRALPFTLLPLVIVLAARATQPIGLLIALHLATFFVATMVCHGEIARDRPSTQHLTEFYLWMSVGGMLGGLFNALIAPQLFTGIAEYPLMLVLTCLLLPRAAAAPASDGPVASPSRLPQLLDLGLPAGLSALCALLVTLAELNDVPSGPASTGLMFGLPALLCFSFSRRPLRFGLGIGAILLVSAWTSGVSGQALYAERSFFGVHRVTLDPTGQYHLLLHGSTLHGKQSLDPARQQEPLTYYYPSGPLGQLFDALKRGPARPAVGVVGLGSGAIACYATPGQQWTFYEIDPTVARIARDSRYFHFLSDCTPQAQVVLGDARLSLSERAGQPYDLLVLDAYSSDSIPMHLMTREALQLYVERLAPHGLLVFHISNRHLDLEPVLGNLAHDAGLASLTQDDAALSQAEESLGKQASQWVVLARQPEDLAMLAADARWQPLRRNVGAIWTDQFSSIVGVFR